MANVDSSDVPRPNEAEHTFFQNVTCYVHIYAPTTLHASPGSAAPETRAAVGSPYQSESQSVNGNPFTVASNLYLINLEKAKLRRPVKRQALLEWSIRKLQKLLDKVI
jgi:hypothetical protein